MKSEVCILIAEDDDGHAALIKKNLKRSGITNEIIHFKDGEELLNFFYGTHEFQSFQKGKPYLLLLDIRMPKVDGVEALRRIKQDEQLRPIPVIMITTTDDPREVERCHKIGCNNYIAKPVDYDSFANAVRQLGLFLAVVNIPSVSEGV